MSCVKTGAYFLLRPHNIHLVGDLYSVGDCFVLRVSPESMSYTPSRVVTHVVDVRSGCWDRAGDLGVVVVPAARLKVVVM